MRNPKITVRSNDVLDVGYLLMIYAGLAYSRGGLIEECPGDASEEIIHAWMSKVDGLILREFPAEHAAIERLRKARNGGGK